MPMTKEEYEEILNKLVDKDLEQSERTELLQTLRSDYNTVLSDFEDFEKKTAKLEKDNNDLVVRSEEHTSELQSRGHLVCRLLLEKKKDAWKVVTYEWKIKTMYSKI